MKSLPLSYVLLIAALLLPSVARAQTGSLSEADTLGAAQAWAEAVGHGDVAALSTLLDNDYKHIHATALVESKEAFIKALQSGARVYDPIHIEEEQVRIFGDAAVVTGKFALKATTPKRVIEGVNRFTLVIVKKPEGLRVVHFQATSIPQ